MNPLRILLLLGCLFAWACDQIGVSTGAGEAVGIGGTTAASPVGFAGAAGACQGFIDRSGACRDVTCLLGSSCGEGQGCEPGVLGPGACLARTCAFIFSTQGCLSNDDCVCGFCGAEGRCYGDSTGGCGQCLAPTVAADRLSKTNDARGVCRSCLSSCQGVGPACCAGCGCLCEDACQGCRLFV